MRKNLKTKTALIATLFLSGAVLSGTGALARELTADGKVLCTIQTARAMSSVTELCDCSAVTTEMLQYLRRQKNFPSILEEASGACPGLASVLRDVPAASTLRPEREKDEKRVNNPNSTGDDDGSDDNGSGSGEGHSGGGGGGHSGGSGEGHSGGSGEGQGGGQGNCKGNGIGAGNGSGEGGHEEGGPGKGCDEKLVLEDGATSGN